AFTVAMTEKEQTDHLCRLSERALNGPSPPNPCGMRKCATKYCRGRTSPTQHSPFCPKCRSRHWRETHPVAYFFNKLRYRAKERGWDFSLARDQFEILWRQKGLNGGKTKFSLTFDRI